MNNNIIKGISVTLLILAVFDLPYGYYEFLRIIIAIISSFLANQYYNQKKYNWFVIMFMIAILWNPLLPIHLDKNIGIFLNLLAATIFAASINKK